MFGKLLNRNKTSAPPSAPPVDASEAVAEGALALAREPAPAVKSPSPAGAPDRSDRWDWVIASLCISAGVIGLRTVNDPVLWSEFSRGTSGAQVIGTLVKKKGGVRFRPAVSPLWHDVSAGSESVADGDTVFTGDDGQAELQLADGSRAEIEPNSLIVVSRGGSADSQSGGWMGGALGAFFATAKPQSLIQIEKGAARVSLKKDTSPVHLRIQGKVYNLTSRSGGGAAEVSVGGKGSGAQIAAVSGDGLELADAGIEGGKVELSQGSQAVVQTGKTGLAEGLSVRKIVVTPLAPAPGEELVQAPEEPVGFGWRREGGDAAAGGPLRLELEGAENKSEDVASATGQARVSLAPGSYRWRLVVPRTQGQPGAETAWQSFTLVGLVPPRAIGPVEGAWINVPKGEREASVLYSWEAQAPELMTELECTPKDGKPRTERIDGASGRQVSLPVGAYQWRLRSVSRQKDQASAWSKEMSFSVREPSQATSGGTPAEGTSAILAPPVPTVPAPATPPVVAQAPPPPPVVAPARKAAPPKPRPKPVRVLALSSPSSSTRLGSSERLDQVIVPLQWKALEDARSYEVVVKDDLSGAQILSKSTKVPSLNLGLHSLASTRFTYQVTAITESGEKIVSPPVPFEIQLAAPVLKTPLDGTSVTPSKQGTLLITWERTVLTDSYVVEISQDPSFTKKVREETASRNLLSLRGLNLGVSYYWRVQSIAHGHKSEWSQPSLFVLESR